MQGTAGGGISFRLTGDKALDRLFATLPMKVQRKAIAGPLREGAKIIAEAAKKNAPKQTGLLRRAIKVRAAKRSRRNKNLVTVRPQIGAGDFKGETFYGAFQEFGYHAGKRRKRADTSDNRRFVEGKHFMEHAFMTTAEFAKWTIINGIKGNIEQEAARQRMFSALGSNGSH